MRWPLSMIAAALLPACFYMDPINERPSADIFQVNPELPFRDDPITVEPRINDPDGDETHVEWRAYACDDDGCDMDEPYRTSVDFIFQFNAPVERVSGAPATLMHLELDVTDDWGAESIPRQTLDLPLDNHAPEIAQPQSRSIYDLEFENEFPVGTPVRVTVTATDLDDEGALRFDEPELFPPTGVPESAATLTRVDDDDDDGEAWFDLLATAPGDWSVVFSVRDPLEASDVSTAHTVAVGEDKMPCIGQVEPAFPPSGAFVIVDELRSFAVRTVLDDLDVYPPVDRPYVGTASFRWYLDGQPLAVDGNAVEIDPELYAPGTQLDLRVEAVDRADQPLCDSSLATCEDRPACFQRRSWAVEIR